MRDVTGVPGINGSAISLDFRGGMSGVWGRASNSMGYVTEGPRPLLLTMERSLDMQAGWTFRHRDKTITGYEIDGNR